MSSIAPALDLPPPYRLVTLRELGDAHAHACQVAAAAGPATFVWARRYDALEIAVVLEPWEPLSTARRAFFVGMIALADAMAAQSPPGKMLTFDWPDTILLDGARIGGGRLGWPIGCREENVPAWLVFSAMLIAARPVAAAEGPISCSTSFEEEGFDPGARERVAESFARSLLRYFDQYDADGFAPITAAYLARLARPGKTRQLAIDNTGALVIEADNGGTSCCRRRLVPRLDTPGWLDPESGSVRA